MSYLIKEQLRAAAAKRNAPALDAADVRPTLEQPSWQNPRQPGDMFTAPERTPDQVAAVVDNAGGSIAAGVRSRLDNTGAPPAPNSGNTGDPTARNILRQTLSRR